jgi:hypothetical protein
MGNININMDSLKQKKEWKRHKIQEGVNIVRFLPPFGAESNGYPYRKWNVIWGLVDPTNGRKRPFASPITIENRCPVYEYLKLLKAKVEALKADLIKQGKNEEEIKERLKDTNAFIASLTPKKIYAWNAVDKSGTVGILELKATAHKAVTELMTQYINDYNQDPTSLGNTPEDSGLWFAITRSGMGLKTEYKVAKNQAMVKVNGIPSYQDDRSHLPEAVASGYEKLGYDLANIYQKKTYDQIKEILLANLYYQVQENADLKIDGFYVDLGANGEGAKVQAPAAQASVQQTPITKGATAPKIKLEVPAEVEDDEDDEVYVAKTTPVKATASNDTDDLLKMADDIFNN